jgi:hypothetical protein
MTKIRCFGKTKRGRQTDTKDLAQMCKVNTQRNVACIAINWKEEMKGSLDIWLEERRPALGLGFSCIFLMTAAEHRDGVT